MKKILTIILLLTLLSGLSITAFASGTDDLHSKEGYYSFNEKDFPGTTISYGVNGAPIVVDPNANPKPILRSVSATIKSPYGYMYSSSSLKESTLLFSIPRGKTVVVIDSNFSSKVAKIKYAGYTGYIRRSNLNF